MFARCYCPGQQPMALAAAGLLLVTAACGCDAKSTTGSASSTPASATPSDNTTRAKPSGPSCLRGPKSPKTTEAVNAIGAISRAATHAYEREETFLEGQGEEFKTVHRLCASATDAPARVPKATKARPADHKAFDTGDQQTGWKCLKFGLTQPHYYQYAYRAGSNYKGPKRGGPDPGPNGFEASAEGDLNGDGKTSLYTIVGTINAKKELRIQKLFSVDPNE
jgi:hypothetical protein